MERIVSDMKEDCDGRTKRNKPCQAPATWEDSGGNAWCRHHTCQAEDWANHCPMVRE